MSILLPNTQYDDPDLVSPATTRLICYGVQRSGSSYVWQLACDCFGGDGVIKTHNYLPASKTIPTLCTYRDFRDCLVSNWRLQHPTWKELHSPEIRRMCRGWLEHVIVHLDHYREHVPGKMFLRYEEFMRNPAVILRALRRVCDIDERTWQASLEEHGIARNRELCPKEDGESRERGKKLLLVANHVHEGKVGTWRRFVSDSDAELLTELLLPALERWGYEP